MYTPYSLSLITIFLENSLGISNFSTVNRPYPLLRFPPIPLYCKLFINISNSLCLIVNIYKEVLKLVIPTSYGSIPFLVTTVLLEKKLLILLRFPISDLRLTQSSIAVFFIYCSFLLFFVFLCISLVLSLINGLLG